jgi:hypothetical protein
MCNNSIEAKVPPVAAKSWINLSLAHRWLRTLFHLSLSQAGAPQPRLGRRFSGLNFYFETNGNGTLCRESGRRRKGRHPTEFRRMAVERLQRCENMVALSEELGVHRRLL